MNNTQILIIGAGLAGLAAALKIEKQGGRALIFEESEAVGGKLKTEVFEDSYLLDHGFQVLLPAYPALRHHVNLNALDLKYFKSGALIFNGTQKLRISDPLQDPSLLFETLFSKVGHFKDKWLIVKLRISVLSQSNEKLLSQSLGTSLDFLRRFGFSDDMIENFWRPFFSGIFLEDELRTEASFLKFLFKMFSQSPVAVPAKGIAVLPNWMQQQLKNSEVLLQSRVISSTEKSVTLENGKSFSGPVIDTRPVASDNWGSVTTLYFAASESPIQGPYLFLNRKMKDTLVNHVAVMTEVSQDYAKKGDALISVNILRSHVSPQDFSKVLIELGTYFGPQVKAWRFLKSFEISKALPLYLQTGVQPSPVTPSQQGAFQRGQALALRLGG